MAFVGFKIHTTDDGRALPWEYYPVAATLATTYIGQPLKIATTGVAIGKLLGCSATDKPDYICMTNERGLADGSIVPVVKVQPDVIWETAMTGGTEPETELPIGTNVQLDVMGGTGASFTTTSGVFTLLTPAAKKGDIVRGRFL